MRNIGQIPGFLEAYNKILDDVKKSREQVWCSCNTVVLNRFECNPLSLRAFNDLSMIDSPFVCGGDIGPDDVANYIWRCRTNYKPNTPLQTTRQLVFYIRSLWGWAKTANAIIKHINNALDESPDHVGEKSKGGGRRIGMEIVPATASIVDEISSNYAFSPLDVPDLPIKLIFQLQRAIRQRTWPKYVPADPKSIATFKREGLLYIQQERAEKEGSN
jgi:hypothetical protein